MTQAYFDQWYADMAASPARDKIVARTLGVPPELAHAGVLTWPALAEVAGELRLPLDGGLLLDIACGRGAYGIEIARRTGSRLIGVDFSTVALDQARSISAGRRSAEFRLGTLTAAGPPAEFRLGTLTATGLPAATADGLICVDAVQFAAPPLAALIEFRRLLKPGGRAVLTCWEAADPADERVPERIRAVNLGRDLPAAGFADVQVQERPQWREAERALWAAAVAAVDPDPAVLSLQAEGQRSLATFDSMRRVLATATAPG